MVITVDAETETIARHLAALRGQHRSKPWCAPLFGPNWCAPKQNVARSQPLC